MNLIARGASERLARRTVGLGRARYRYRGQGADEEEQRPRALVVALARQHPRYGCRRIAALLRRQGHAVNHKRVWREEGLAVPQRRARKRRAGTAAALPARAAHRGHVWTDDFGFDATEWGQALGERVRGELRREAVGRVPERGGVLGRGARTGGGGALAAALQRGAAAQRTGLPDASGGRRPGRGSARAWRPGRCRAAPGWQTCPRARGGVPRAAGPAAGRCGTTPPCPSPPRRCARPRRTSAPRSPRPRACPRRRRRRPGCAWSIDDTKG
jgi:hypothetical protein